MSNSFIMTESIVRPAKMPYGRLKDNGFVGIEGEHAARALVVETKDDLSAFASINLIIDDLDCGAMTKTISGSTTTLSMTLTSSMIGRSGRKICQLIMVNSGNTVVQKSSQFEAYVGRANEIERSVDDGVTIIILSEAVTEMAREAAAAAAEEAVADVVEDCQAIADAASASADAAAQSASDAQTAAASITVDAALDPTSTHAIQNKAVASEISSLRADLGEVSNQPNISWIIGSSIGSDGNIGPASSYAYSNEIAVDAGGRIKRATPYRDANSRILLIHVCQYDSLGTFISRATLADGGEIIFESNTASIRFNFGRAASLGVPMTAEDITAYFREKVYRKAVLEVDVNDIIETKIAESIQTNDLINIPMSQSIATNSYNKDLKQVPTNTYFFYRTVV